MINLDVQCRSMQNPAFIEWDRGGYVAKILIVDDDEVIRVLFSDILERGGHEIECASNGVHAVKMLKGQAFDLVITDVLMPNMDGFELISSVQKISPNSRVITISGGGRILSDKYLKVAAALGSTITLSKPVSSEELLQAVDDVLA